MAIFRTGNPACSAKVDKNGGNHDCLPELERLDVVNVGKKLKKQANPTAVESPLTVNVQSTSEAWVFYPVQCQVLGLVGFQSCFSIRSLFSLLCLNKGLSNKNVYIYILEVFT